jgi:hypothetical protein
MIATGAFGAPLHYRQKTTFRTALGPATATHPAERDFKRM